MVFYLLPPQQFSKALKINFPRASGSVSRAKVSLESISGSWVPVLGALSGDTEQLLCSLGPSPHAVVGRVPHGNNQMSQHE